MPASGRSRLIIAAILLLALTACSGQPTTDNGGSGQTTAATAPSASAGGEPAAGPMTGAELVWLEGISALHKTMDSILQDSPSALTAEVMRSLAKQLAGCTPALDKLGPPTDRLRPVHDIAGQGCAQYEKGGKCFATAASLGIVVGGSAEEKKQTDAMSCGFSTPGEGSKFFAEAEGKGFDIKEDAH